MKQRNQSQIINNFFTFASIIIISITLTLYVKYIVNEPEITKEEVVALSCEKDTLTKYKVYNQKLLNDSLKALRKGYYKLNYTNKKDIPDEIFSKEDLDSLYIQAIGKTPKENINKFLEIKYTLLEKDKNSKIGKIKRNSFYSGSIMTTFRADNKDIFKIFTDFRLYDDREVSSRIECIIKVYENNAKKI